MRRRLPEAGAATSVLGYSELDGRAARHTPVLVHSAGALIGPGRVALQSSTEAEPLSLRAALAAWMQGNIALNGQGCYASKPRYETEHRPRMTPPAPVVTYLRVSTDRQGQSGLGLEAQRAAVAAYMAGRTLLGEFVEVESGRKDDPPQLAAALGLCRQHKARLVIAKLDRLARSVALISGLMESGVEFVAADMPEANRFMLHVMAAVAEHEREMISQRTRVALAAAKARGTRLGNPRPDLAKMRTMVSDRVASFRAGVVPEIQKLQAEGCILREVAAALNARGVSASRGGSWHPASVRAALRASSVAKTAIVPFDPT